MSDTSDRWVWRLIPDPIKQEGVATPQHPNDLTWEYPPS
jgi:hypothetical protein